MRLVESWIPCLMCWSFMAFASFAMKRIVQSCRVHWRRFAQARLRHRGHLTRCNGGAPLNSSCDADDGFALSRPGATWCRCALADAPPTATLWCNVSACAAKWQPSVPPGRFSQAFYSCLLLFFILLYLWNLKKEKTQEGLLTGIFMIFVFTLRFFYEFLKENQSSFENGLSLNMGQILSIPAVLFGLGVLWYAKRKA